VPDFSHEISAGRNDGKVICGVDEVGRGPWAGPVVAAALVLPHDFPESLLVQIRDSKKMSAVAREKLFAPLTDLCPHAIAEASVGEIDQLNILWASMLAMQRAVDQLSQSLTDFHIIKQSASFPLLMGEGRDGGDVGTRTEGISWHRRHPHNQYHPHPAPPPSRGREFSLMEMGRNNSVELDLALVDGNRAPKISCATQIIIKGDDKSYSIAAASIIAKVHRDRLMKKLAEEFPHYGWESNAGYGTAQHIAGLATHGVTRWHRTSFAPIRAALGNSLSRKAGEGILSATSSTQHSYI